MRDLQIIEKSIFIKYIDYFHDGILIDIQQTKNSITLIMESAEIDPEDMNDNILLTQNNSLKGKLHLEKIISVKINNKIHVENLYKAYDHGTILDFEIEENTVELGITWTNFHPKTPTNDFSVIEIEADKIWWENLPDFKI